MRPRRLLPPGKQRARRAWHSSPAAVQNVTPEFRSRAEKAARTGEMYEQTLQAGNAYGQMAGIASAAKYAAGGRERHPVCSRCRP